MTRALALIIAALTVLGAQTLSAQDLGPERGTFELTIAPGGATFFTSKDAAPDFGNYTLGGTVAWNLTRIFAVEGEVGGTLGVSQDFGFGGTERSQKTPNTLNYSGNFVVNAPTRRSLVPYVTAGVGGLTMFEKASLGIDGTETYLTGNAGGGVKWYASNGRWGVRGDYRFIAVRGKDGGTPFFGRDDRYGHRVAAGFILNLTR